MMFWGLQDKAEHSEDLICITLNSLISGFTLLALISEVYHLGKAYHNLWVVGLR